MSNNNAIDFQPQNSMSSSEGNKIEQTRTAGGHIEDRSQPALPVYHRKLANPAPLGLLSFATGTIQPVHVSYHGSLVLTSC